MNSSAEGFIPCPGTPTIAFLAEKSRVRWKNSALGPPNFPAVEHLLEPINGPHFSALAPSHFSTATGRGSLRTIDPVTTPRRDLVQDGSLFRLSRASRGGAISRRRDPFACFGHIRGGFRAVYFSRAAFRATGAAQALPVGNPLSIFSTHRRKTRRRSLCEGRFH